MARKAPAKMYRYDNVKPPMKKGGSHKGSHKGSKSMPKKYK